MRNDLTEIVVILDKSGSMASCKTDAEGGLNTFIEEQRALPGDANFTLIEFSNNSRFVYNAVPIKDVTKYKLVPGGSTALLDAIGEGILKTGERVAQMSEDQRPGLVVFIILTDGEENASREFSNSRIREMITHQTDIYKWQFRYLGANQDAFSVGGNMGLSAGTSGNYSSPKRAFAAGSSNISRMRGEVFTSGEIITPDYSSQERCVMESKS